MKERPILFSAPMVRAILEGRKSQTRRVVKPQPFAGWYPSKCTNGWGFCHPQGEAPAVLFQCPYGVPGDRLWVRETWAYFNADEDLYQKNKGALAFRATWDSDRCEWPQFARAISYIPGDRWRPSIHMPRWASRITLEITDVRVERLQEISEEDALAEGVREIGGNFEGCYEFCDRLSGTNARDCFGRGWDSINAKRGSGWDANPWVWAISFRRLP